jgi:hypothetical protein
MDGMRLKPANPSPLSPARRRMTVVCLLLVGIAVAAEGFHSHPHNLATDAKHCITCQVAHAPAQVAPAAHFDVVLADAAFLTSGEKPDPKQGPPAFALFCRPPPVIKEFVSNSN